MVAVLAVFGLVVSVAAAWSRLGPEPSVRAGEPGPRVVATAPARAAPTRPAPAPGAGAGHVREDRPVVGRSDAGVFRSVKHPAGPVGIRLGSVDVQARVRPVGTSADGQMRLPPDPRVFGWYRYAGTPGVRRGGSTVIAGHLDSLRYGLGPLVRLREVKVGDPVRVTVAGGAQRSYTVVGVRRFDRQALPARLFSRQGPERLRIITCGGAFDTLAGGYQQNLVVTAVPTS